MNVARTNAALQVLLICPSRPMKAEITRLISRKLLSVQVIEQASYPNRSFLLEALGKKPSVCFIDISSDRSKALSLVAEMHEIDSGLLIIAILSANDPDLILRGLRQGASEFLVAPFTDEDVQHIAERIGRLQSNRPLSITGSARVIAVVSAKGSCGASTVAAALAYQCKRSGSRRTLLADFDPLTGILSFLLKTTSKYSFLDVISRIHTLDADIWKGIVSSVNGVDLLHSPDNPVDGNSDLGDAGAIVSFSRHLYDTVVLDMDSPFGDWSLNIARLCDELLLVTTNELPAVQAAQRVLTYLEQNQIDRTKLRLIVNRFSNEGLSRSIIETALGIEIFQILPNDPDGIKKALVGGKPAPPGSSIGKGVKEITDRLMGELADQQTKKPSSISGWFSMFSRSSS